MENNTDDGGQSPSSNSGSNTATPTAAPDDSETTPNETPSTSETPVLPGERNQLVEQLPEPSPLATTLVELVASSDRQSTANEQGLDYHESTHAVQVQITLQSESELPDGYRIDVLDSYQNIVTAYVHIDDLVPVAMDDSVRIIRPPVESRPGTNR